MPQSREVGQQTLGVRVNWEEDELGSILCSFNTLIEYFPVNGKYSNRASKDYSTLLVSARPISGDSEISSGGGVSRRPVQWLLVPGPVAGVERLRAAGGRD
jgi:hypothetical protein